VILFYMHVAVKSTCF